MSDRLFMIREPFDGYIMCTVEPEYMQMLEKAYNKGEMDNLSPTYAAIHYHPDTTRFVDESRLEKLMTSFESSLVTQPELVTRERYWEMLEVLPPCRWTNYHGVEFFHVSEHLRGDLVSWFAQRGDKYYEFTDYSKKPLSELFDKVIKAEAQQSA